MEIFGLLRKFPNLHWVAPDLKIADYAARLRAAYGLRTPDALQAATAVAEKTTAFVTNDAVFTRVLEFETILLQRT
jgi:predicted nucleic acid-binding protein